MKGIKNILHIDGLPNNDPFSFHGVMTLFHTSAPFSAEMSDESGGLQSGSSNARMYSGVLVRVRNSWYRKASPLLTLPSPQSMATGIGFPVFSGYVLSGLGVQSYHQPIWSDQKG